MLQQLTILKHKNASESEYGRHFTGMFSENREVVSHSDGTEVHIIYLIEAQHVRVLIGW